MNSLLRIHGRRCVLMLFVFMAVVTTATPGLAESVAADHAWLFDHRKISNPKNYTRWF